MPGSNLRITDDSSLEAGAAFAFTRKVYRLHKGDYAFVARAEMTATAIVEQMSSSG